MPQHGDEVRRVIESQRLPASCSLPRSLRKSRLRPHATVPGRISLLIKPKAGRVRRRALGRSVSSASRLQEEHHVLLSAPTVLPAAAAVGHRELDRRLSAEFCVAFGCWACSGLHQQPASFQKPLACCPMQHGGLALLTDPRRGGKGRITTDHFRHAVHNVLYKPRCTRQGPPGNMCCCCLCWCSDRVFCHQPSCEHLESFCVHVANLQLNLRRLCVRSQRKELQRISDQLLRIKLLQGAFVLRNILIFVKPQSLHNVWRSERQNCRSSDQVGQ
mmetsp:Transcript_52134/g.104398  ORF Transcript_52134/g.104398 Transcript_52134/m.104398 type:complete len:274 (+) Transcript_52134:27-848(+)